MDVKFVHYTRDVKGEIPITANGTYDVKKYATANVNVVSNPVLLWTNASPSSNFANQTIQVNGEGYNGYIVEARYIASAAKVGYSFLLISNSYQVIAARDTASSVETTMSYRMVSNVTKDGLQFNNGYSGGGSTATAFCVPTRIWGVKFTL